MEVNYDGFFNDAPMWKPYRIKLIPMRIKGRWYWPGSTVYRKFVLSPGGGGYCYGDEFDVLKST